MRTHTNPKPGNCGRGWRAAVLMFAAVGSASAQSTIVTNIYTPTANYVPGTVSAVAMGTLNADKARLTVAVNETNNATTVVKVTLGGAQATLVNSVTNFIDPDYYVTNYYDLNPVYATLGVTGVPSTGGGAEAVLGLLAMTNTTTGNITSNVTFALNYTNLASGDYDMAFLAAGNNTWRYPLPVKAGYMWSAGGGANTNFNEAANWVGGVVPGANDIVILDTAGAVAANNQPTIAVMADTTISSVSDIHTGDNYNHWYIHDGVKLSLLGDGGFRQLVDIIDTAQRSRIRASGGGTLLVSNANAKFNMFTTRQNNSTDSANFSALNTLILDVNSISFNDILAYPNIRTNGTTAKPDRNVYDMTWARTNILRATQTDANNWTNEVRNYSMVINRERNQTGNDGAMHFGLWNELYMDSILFGGYSQMENPQVDFQTTGGHLIMRGPDKVSRVSMLCIADAMDPLQTGANNSGGTKINVSLVRGTVDAMVDTLILARNPRYTANGAATGKLWLGAATGNSTFDVNNAFIGYQTGACDGTESGAATGQLFVQSNTLFRVNGNMVLGYTETNTTTVVTGYGQLSVTTSSGVAHVNNITVGGPANASTGANNVTVGSGATLVVSNSMGSPSAPVTTLNVAGTLVLPGLVSTTQTNVYAMNLSGNGGVISLPGITADGIYVIARYTASALPTWSLSLPPGFFGFLTIDAADQTVKAVVSATAPKTCVWVGNVSGDWDTTTLNWKELVTGNATNFSNGDAVLFDDSAVTPSVNITENVIPAGGTIITNNTLNYTFSGASIEGTAGTVKSGTGSVTYNNIHLPSVSVATNGLLVVNGELRGGLSFRGSLAVNNGTLLGSVSLPGSGSVLVNNGTITTTPNALSMVAGNTVTNNTGATFNNGNSSDTTYPVGSTFVNKGQINNISKRIYIKGTWINDGGIVTDLTATSEALLASGSGRLTLDTDGQVIIGPNGMKVEGRFDNMANSLINIDVDRGASPNCQFITVDYFGNMRGTFVMNNVGGTPFAIGDSYTVMKQTYDLAKTNSTAADKPKASPGAAGIGRQWDVNGMLATLPVTSSVRTIGVAAAPTDPPPTMTCSYTNGGSMLLSWPATNISYQLQVQTNTLAIGISNNWVRVVGSENTNSWSIPVIPENPAVFYRLSNQ